MHSAHMSLPSLLLVLGLAGTLPVAAFGANRQWYDDFGDGNAFDGNPVTWTTSDFPGGYTAFSGSMVMGNGSQGTHILAVDETLSGDVSVRLKGKLGGQGRIFAAAHFSDGCRGYKGLLTSSGAIQIVREDCGTNRVLAEESLTSFNPEGDHTIQLDVSGDALELRIAAGHDPLPEAPQLRVEDTTYRSGLSGAGFETEDSQSRASIHSLWVAEMRITGEASTESFTVEIPGGPGAATAVLNGFGSTPGPGHFFFSYEWDFGDGSPRERGLLPVVEHTYGEPGLYVATLWVRDSRALTASAQAEVAISCSNSADLGAWKSVDQGTVPLPGTVSPAAGGCWEVCATGDGIGLSGIESYHFIYMETAGEFRLEVEVSEILSSAQVSAVGLLARDHLGEGAAQAALLLIRRPGGDQVQLVSRARNGSFSDFVRGGAFDLPLRLRLELTRGEMAASTSTDGTAWTEIARTAIPFEEEIFVGLAAYARDSARIRPSHPVRATVCDLRLEGDFPPDGPFFRRGDHTSDGIVDMTDAVGILDHLFRSGPASSCATASDVNDDGVVDLSDPVALLQYLFRSGAPPSRPFPDCGRDATADPLPCSGQASCP